MNIRNSNDYNSIFKNENLKNMLNKLSEDAKKQFSNSNSSNSSKLNELLNTKFFIDEEKLKKQSKCKFNLENEENNDNFTQEFYMERYKNYIPSNIITPADFNANFDKENIARVFGSGKKNSSLEISFQRNIPKTSSNNDSITNKNFNFFEIFTDKLKSDLIISKINQINFENWLNCYNELHSNNKEQKIHLREFLRNMNSKENRTITGSILYKLHNFFSKYLIDSDKEILIGEILDVKFIDNLQILKIKDFNLNTREIVIFEENSDGINLNSLIKDDQFEISEVILLKRNSMRLLNPQNPNLWIIALNNIKQLK